MSFKAIPENKILAKITGSTVSQALTLCLLSVVCDHGIYKVVTNP